jgi:hypothetical protein
MQNVRPWCVGLLSSVVLLAACHDGHAPTGCVIGSGVVASESRAVAAFSGVTVDGPFRVTLRPAAATSLELTAEDNVLPRIRTEVRGDRLHVFLVDGSQSTTREMAVRIASPELRAVEGSAAAQIEARGFTVDALETRLSEASSLVVTGRADRHDLHLAGASRCRAEELRSRWVSAELSGASNGIVAVSDTLDVRASGASTLEYLGDPALTLAVSGLSVVRPVKH